MKKLIIILNIFALIASSCSNSSNKPGEIKLTTEATEIKYSSDYEGDDSSLEEWQVYFSEIFVSERDFLGCIGDEKQKMGIVFLSTIKIGETEYEVTGKSKVKNNICDFTGTMEVLDLVFEDGNPSQIASIYGKYHFKEDENQPHSGEFEGEFSIFWSDNDRTIFSVGNRYGEEIHVDFNGTWTNYQTSASKFALWGNVENLLPGTINEGQEYFRDENYSSLGWGPFFDRKPNGYFYIKPCDKETIEKAEKEYQKQWVNWWK